tara:strand:+ start:50739 stop:51065 length:327 start_codon:yes stop_codon:yes gene_type:complete
MASTQYWNRYSQFLVNEKYINVPFIKLPGKPTDNRTVYTVGVSRLDKLSQQYYGTPYFGWLILSANPEFGGLESNIPNKRVLTIPFPLVASLQDYKKEVETHFFYYGR